MSGSSKYVDNLKLVFNMEDMNIKYPFKLSDNYKKYITTHNCLIEDNLRLFCFIFKTKNNRKSVRNINRFTLLFTWNPIRAFFNNS